MNIFDPTTKMLIQMAQMALDTELNNVAAKHNGNHKAVDAIHAAKAAVDGAIQALVALQQ